MSNPLDAFDARSERLLAAVQQALASGQLHDPNSADVGEIQAMIAELTSALQKTDKELDEALAQARAETQAFIQKKAAEQVAKAARPLPTELFNPGDLLDGARIQQAIDSLCEKHHAPGARTATRATEGDVAAMHTSEWSEEAEPPPQARPQAPAQSQGKAAPHSSPRQRRKPKAGTESFEWESTDEWDRKGM